MSKRNTVHILELAQLLDEGKNQAQICNLTGMKKSNLSLRLKARGLSYKEKKKKREREKEKKNNKIEQIKERENNFFKILQDDIDDIELKIEILSSDYRKKRNFKIYDTISKLLKIKEKKLERLFYFLREKLREDKDKVLNKRGF